MYPRARAFTSVLYRVACELDARVSVRAERERPGASTHHFRELVREALVLVADHRLLGALVILCRRLINVSCVRAGLKLARAWPRKDAPFTSARARKAVSARLGSEGRRDRDAHCSTVCFSAASVKRLAFDIADDGLRRGVREGRAGAEQRRERRAEGERDARGFSSRSTASSRYAARKDLSARAAQRRRGTSVRPKLLAAFAPLSLERGAALATAIARASCDVYSRGLP